MATIEQVKTLIKTHYDRDNEKFKKTALNIAASETRNGDAAFGREIVAIIESSPCVVSSSPYNVNGEDDLVVTSFPTRRMGDLVLTDEASSKLQRIVSEYHQRGKLEPYGLSCHKKILIEGFRGTGKTMVAEVLAAKLRLPLLTVKLGKLSETDGSLCRLFDMVANHKGVYLFDDLDGKSVSDSLLRSIKNDVSESVIVATTSNKEILNKELLYHFDDVLHLKLPTTKQVKQIVANNIGGFDSDFTLGDKVASDISELCQADIVRVCKEVMKDCLLGDFPMFDELFERAFDDRLYVYDKLESELF